MNNLREDGRSFTQLRPIKLKYDSLGYADASVLIETGQTKVLVSITLQDGVPPFLKGQKTGWLTAEYAMLPCATQKRTKRDSSQQQRNSRSIEISRLIGRTLRSVIDLSKLGERTIMIDCDVLQADGGTRVASITATSFALNLAINRWIEAKILNENILKELVAGISVGKVEGNLVLDLSYIEDSNAEVDFNFIITESGRLIEIQGTAEKSPISWQEFESLKNLATDGIKQLFSICNKIPQNITTQKNINLAKSASNQKEHAQAKAPFFSLGNRLEKTSL
jgi:ribonuclease PH